MDEHELRKRIDELVYEVEAVLKNDMTDDMARAYKLVRTKLQEAKMWLGMSIGALHMENDPFPKELRDFSDKRE